MPFEIAALGAALSWAAGGLIAANPARELGGPRFTRLRMVWVSFALVVWASLLGEWSSIDGASILWLGVSGVVGLTLGDAALFTAFNRIGPRRTSILFTTNAPIAAFLGWLIFDDLVTVAIVIGTALIVAGVMLAVASGQARTHPWERIDGSPWVGIAWALFGALCQAGGLLLSKPAFDAGAGSVSAGAVRALVATPLLFAFARPMDAIANGGRAPATTQAITPRLFGLILVSGTLGMVVGQTLLLYAIDNGDVGVASVLSAMSPVLMLPLIWTTTRERPALGAWIGAALAVAGTAFLVT